MTIDPTFSPMAREVVENQISSGLVKAQEFKLANDNVDDNWSPILW